MQECGDCVKGYQEEGTFCVWQNKCDERKNPPIPLFICKSQKGSIGLLQIPPPSDLSLTFISLSFSAGTCDVNAHCIYTIPLYYDCICNEGYTGNKKERPILFSCPLSAGFIDLPSCPYVLNYFIVNLLRIG